MTDTNQSWHFHPASRMVLDATKSNVICFLAPRQDQSVGQLLASAPVLAAIANDLRAQLRESLVAWEGEEDSVREYATSLLRPPLTKKRTKTVTTARLRGDQDAHTSN